MAGKPVFFCLDAGLHQANNKGVCDSMIFIYVARCKVTAIWGVCRAPIAEKNGTKTEYHGTPPK